MNKLVYSNASDLYSFCIYKYLMIMYNMLLYVELESLCIGIMIKK